MCLIRIKLGIDKTVAELDQELEDSSKIRIAAATNTIVKTNIQLNKEVGSTTHHDGYFGEMNDGPLHTSISRRERTNKSNTHNYEAMLA